MPESPETAKSTDWLVKHLRTSDGWRNFTGIALISKGQKYDDIDIELCTKALDQPLEDVFCQGKHYFICLAEGVVIHAHFMMGGEWTDKYVEGAHFRMNFGEVKVYFNSFRFGKFEILSTLEKFEELAPDFLGRNRITLEIWLQRFNKIQGKSNLRKLLMDQKRLVSGIGNYIIAEIFYRAKLHHSVTVKELSEQQRIDLFHISKNFIEGMYRGTEEKMVYKKGVDPYGNKVVGVKMTDNRTMWTVPAIQGE